MPKTNHDYLRLAQWAYQKCREDTYTIRNRAMLNKYIDTLALVLDIPFETAEEMAKDPDFRLPKEEKENA